MFGLGVQELVILVVLAVILFGVPFAVILVVLGATRRNTGGRIAELEAENERLRDELDRRPPPSN
jgi:hypothetical protein